MNLSTILSNHKAWVDDPSTGTRLTTEILNTVMAEVREKGLYNANLSGANLTSAELYRADLTRSCLYRANLTSANLYCANLAYTNLAYTNLTSANLTSANLTSANLTRTDLRYACLDSADLSDARLPEPTMMLLARWGVLSPDLCAQAMMFDADAHHRGVAAFDQWANDGPCPYHGTKYGRACNFSEHRKDWDPSIPSPRTFDLMVALIREKCADSDYHEKDLA